MSYNGMQEKSTSHQTTAPHVHPHTTCMHKMQWSYTVQAHLEFMNLQSHAPNTLHMYGFSYIRLLITVSALYRVLPYRINHLNHTGILNPYKVSPGWLPNSSSCSYTSSEYKSLLVQVSSTVTKWTGSVYWVKCRNFKVYKSIDLPSWYIHL